MSSKLIISKAKNKAQFDNEGRLISGGDSYLGDSGSNTFQFGAAIRGGWVTIDGGTSTILASSSNKSDASYSGALGTGATDSTLVIKGRPGAPGSINTAETVLGEANAVDIISFTSSGDFSNIDFTHIEKLELASGIRVSMTFEQFANNLQSLDNGDTNPGLHVVGVGKKAAVLTLLAEPSTSAYVPTLANATTQHYAVENCQLDDASIAAILQNAFLVLDLKTNSDEDVYGRADGTNNDDTVWGSLGSNNATLRLGNDTFMGNDSSDAIWGHGGADSLVGGAGNDYFMVGSFGSGKSGTSSKADDGRPEWIISQSMAKTAGVSDYSVNKDQDYKGKYDVIDGGQGYDIFRVTTGIGADSKDHGTVVLNDANFKNMEKIEVGGLLKAATTEDSSLQIINNHYYFNSAGSVVDTLDSLGNNGGSINNVVINASGVTKKGLIFEGNANQQTFIGTAKNDVFIGNGGHDILTGGVGADRFVFGNIVSWSTTTDTSPNPTGYVKKSSTFSGSKDSDTITDFQPGVDIIQLNIDRFTNLGAYYRDDDGLYSLDPVKLATVANFVSGAGAVALNDKQFLIYDTSTGILAYDADGSGAVAAEQIAVLGINSHPLLNFGDIAIR